MKKAAEGSAAQGTQNYTEQTIAQNEKKAREIVQLVTSSCLCKKAEGAIFPLLVEAMEDGVDDAFDAEFVDEADHLHTRI